MVDFYLIIKTKNKKKPIFKGYENQYKNMYTDVYNCIQKTNKEKEMSKKNPNPVYSARVSQEIMDTFKAECERLNVPHSYIISEYMKKFIVLNINRESYEAPLLEGKKMDDLDEILEKE